MLSFLTRNKIMDMAGLDECFGNMIGRQQSIRDKLKPLDRHLKTLDKHIKHSGNYKAHRGKKAQYDKLYAQYMTLTKTTGFGAERKAQKYFPPPMSITKSTAPKSPCTITPRSI